MATDTLEGGRKELQPEIDFLTTGPNEPVDWKDFGGPAASLTHAETQAEMDARAFRSLQNVRNATDPAQVTKEKAALRRYRDYRTRRGEEAFKYLPTARNENAGKTARERVKFFNGVFSGPDRMLEAFPKDQREQLAASFNESRDPDGDKRHVANLLLASTLTGKPQDKLESNWSGYRQQIAEQVFGAQGDVDEARFYGMAATYYTKQQAEQELLTAVADKAAGEALRGKKFAQTMAEAKGLLKGGEDWKRYQTAARSAHASVLAEYSDDELKAMRTLFEAVAQLEGADEVERLNEPEGEDGMAQDNAKIKAIDEALAVYGRADAESRQRIIGGIGWMAKTEGEDVEGFIQRAGAAWSSGNNRLARGLDSLMGNAMLAFATDEEKAQMPTIMGAKDFASDFAASGARIRKFVDDKREGILDRTLDTAIMMVESGPIMLASATPTGFMVNAAAYAEDNRAELRQTNPGLSGEKATAIAYMAGMTEAGIDRLQFLTLGAPVPKLNAALYKYGKAGAVGVGALRATGIGLVETGQEITQDMTAPLVTEIAAALSQDIEGPNWNDVMEREADALGDIFAVSMGFGIIGGAGSTAVEYFSAPALKKQLTDQVGLRLAGIPEAQAAEIAKTAEKSPAAAAELVKVAQIETPPEVRREVAEREQEFLEREAAELEYDQARANLPEIEKDEDGTLYVLYPDGRRDEAESEEDALQAVRTWELDNEDAMTEANRELAAFIESSHEGNPELSAKYKFSGVERDFKQWAEGSSKKLEQARARVRIAMRQQFADGLRETDGSEIEDGDLPLAKYLILGSSKNFGGASTRIAMEINKRGNVATVVEEHAEGVAKWAMDSGRMSREEMAENIRRIEQGTGKVVTPENASDQDIIEGFSRLAVGNFFGKVNEVSGLSAKFKAILRAFREAFSAIVELAAGIREIQLAGQMDENFEELLDIAGGVSMAYRKANLDRQMEADMMETASEQLTEIADTLKGRLPHPETVRKEGGPFLGEIERIYSGIQEQGASKSAGTRKANEFFLPVGESADIDQVMSDINQSGFDFETPGEMLEALDASVNYATPSYSAESFSIGRADDAAYLAAVESGDMETAQKMVDEAARRAGYGYSHRRSDGKDPRETGHVVMFAEDKTANAHYGPKDYVVNLEKAPPIPDWVVEWYMETEEFNDAVELNGWDKETSREQAEQSVNPVDIVNWGDMWDDHRMVSQFWEENESRLMDEGVFAFQTNDGVVVFDSYSNPSAIKSADPVTYDADGNPVPLSERFNPSDDRITHSIARRDSTLLAEIDALTKSPERKAEVYAKMRRNVVDVRKRWEDRAVKRGFTEDDFDDARFEQLRDIAQLEAVARALPPAIRGKVIGSFRKLEELKTAERREDYLVKLLPKVEDALERHLQKLYRQSIRSVMDRSRPTTTKGKDKRGKIGGVGHAIARAAIDAMTLTNEAAATVAAGYREELDGREGDLRLDDFEELEGKAMATELFSDYDNADSARLEKGLEFLRNNYSIGRDEWLQVLTARKAKRESEIAMLRKVLKAPDFITTEQINDARDAALKPGEQLGNGLLEWISSMYQILDRLKERTDDKAAHAWVDQKKRELRDARDAYDDAIEEERVKLNEGMRDIFGVAKGWRGEFELDPILYRLSKRTKNHKIQVLEGFNREPVSVPLRYVEALVNEETAGFERDNGKREDLDAADLQALRDEWEKFQDLPDEARKNRRVIVFERIVSTGKRGSVGKISQLEALKEWLAIRQPDAREKYAAIGWDEKTFEQIDAWLEPEVKRLGLWMVERLEEQSKALNDKHRAEYGVGLDLVMNYFPLLFENAADTDTKVSPDGHNVAVKAKTASGLKARVSHRARPRAMNAVSVFLSNRAQIHYFMTHATPMREMMGVFRSRDASEAIRATLGAGYYKNLGRELSLVESNGVMAADGILEADRLIRKVQSGYALSILGLKISTLMINTTAFWNTLLKVPISTLAKGLSPEYVGDLKKTIDSPALQRRLKYGTSHEMRIAMDGGVGGHPLAAGSRRVAQGSMELIRWWDTFSNSVTAAAAYRGTIVEARKAGASDEAATRQAEAMLDELSHEVMQPANLLSRSLGEARFTNNPIGQLLFLFASEMRKNVSIGLYAARKLVTGKGSMSYAMAAQQAIVLGIFYSATGQMIRSLYQALFKADDDEPEEILARYAERLKDPKAWAYAMSTEHLKGIPLIGEAANHFFAGMFDQRSYDSSPNPLNRFYKGSRKLAQITKDDATTEDRIGATIDAIQGMAGITPETAVFAQAGNVVEDAMGLLNAQGLAISEGERFKRIRARVNKVKRENPGDREPFLEKFVAEMAELDPDMRARFIEALPESFPKYPIEHLREQGLAP